MAKARSAEQRDNEAPEVEWAEQELPIECRPVLVAFPEDPRVSATAERYSDEEWVISLDACDTIFSEGKSLEEAKRNLVLSAEEDYRILSEHRGSLAPHLQKELGFLEYLFGQARIR